MKLRRLLPAILWLLIYLIGLVGTFKIGHDWNQFSAVAVALTGAAVIWYTWETKLLRSESQRQTELQLRPFVVVVPVGPGQFSACNIGNCSALNVAVADVQIDAVLDIYIRFPNCIPFLKKDEDVVVQAVGYRRGEPVGDFFNPHLDPSHANQTLPLRIEFDSVEARRYVVEETVSPREMKIVGIRNLS